jgi:hypothetical protein
MKCEEVQNLIPVSTDDALSDGERRMLEAHLPTCPLCRKKLDDVRKISRDLRMLQRPTLSPGSLASMRQAVAERLMVSGSTGFWLSEDRRPWINAWLMPSGVGTFASIFAAVSFLWLLSLAPARTEYPTYQSASTLNASLLEKYASPRRSVANESPSINPQGALVALTNSLVRGEMKDDEVVVVAEVFGNGLAKIDEVIEPSRDRRAVGELEKALESDPAFAPFVPADMDRRPESVRVVLKIQNVDVNTGISPRGRPQS